MLWSVVLFLSILTNNDTQVVLDTGISIRRIPTRENKTKYSSASCHSPAHPVFWPMSKTHRYIYPRSSNSRSIQLISIPNPLQSLIIFNIIKKLNNNIQPHAKDNQSVKLRYCSGKRVSVIQHTSRLKSPGTPKICLTPICLILSTI